LRVGSTAHVKGIIDGNEQAAITDQGANLIDETCTVVHQVDATFGGRGEEGRVEHYKIKTFTGAFQVGYPGEKVGGEEIGFADGEAVQGAGGLGKIEGSSVEIKLKDALGLTGKARDSEAARVGEGVEDAFSVGVGDNPSAEEAGIEVEAGIAVHREVQGIPDTVLADAIVKVITEDDLTPLLLLGGAILDFYQNSMEPSGERGVVLEIGDGLLDEDPTLGAVFGVIVDHEGGTIQIDGEGRTSFRESVEEAEGGMPGRVEEILSGSECPDQQREE
jgi:hypothetical protein